MIERKYKVAFGKSSKATKWENEELTWNEFADFFKETKRTSETIEEYSNMDKNERGAIKDVGGFVCGYCENGRRTKDSIKSRSIVCLDLDHNPNIEEVWEKAKVFKCIMHSTHSHTPQEPRIRLIIPLDRDVTTEEYEKVAKVLARFISDIEVIDNDTLDRAIGKKSIFDTTTYQANRLMYLPSTSKNGEYIYKNSCDGIKIDRPEGKVEILLKRYEEIEKYESKEDRYTYIKGGNSGNGLQVFDNGLLAYSHQDHDLISGMGECNSFDLVRVHKFGYLDSEEYINNLPSYKLTSFKKCVS